MWAQAAAAATCAAAAACAVTLLRPAQPKTKKENGSDIFFSKVGVRIPFSMGNFHCLAAEKLTFGGLGVNLRFLAQKTLVTLKKGGQVMIASWGGQLVVRPLPIDCDRGRDRQTNILRFSGGAKHKKNFCIAPAIYI